MSDLSLFARAQSGDTSARDELLKLHVGIVHFIARRLARSLSDEADLDELVSAGHFGLMAAVDGFDESRGLAFTTFAATRVRGAMLDELRTMDFLPRLYRRRLRDRERALAQLRRDLGRDPSDAELATALGVSQAVLQRSYQPKGELQLGGGGGNGEANGDNDGDDRDAMDRLADDDLESPIEAIHRRELLAKIQMSLQPVEWKVLQLHYLEGMSGKEVARRLRLSAARICQIHGRVLDRLKHRLRAAAV